MSIKEFYKGQEILITGGSGFIGKVLIEKIMRSCPEFSKIFVLLRNKKKKSCDERLQEILTSKVFDRARGEQPETFNRVEAITGDCAALCLGLSKQDLQKLKNVSIIFHSAASVRFDDPLKKAVLLNTRGTLEILKIAETFSKFKAFVHVSTAYCNSERTEIEEKVYKGRVDWRHTIKLAEGIDEESLNILNLKYNGFKPNTYTFTKALAEQIVEEYKNKLPVLIYRPSIVVSCLDDPIPGWIDNFAGPMGLLVASGIGIFRSNDCDGRKLFAIVPVDIVVRGLIISAYKKGIEMTTKGIHLNSPNNIDVYNCVIDSMSPISLYDIAQTGCMHIRKSPYEKTLWLPGGGFTNCPAIHFIKVIFLHVLPAALIDFILKLNGRSPMILHLQRRLNYALKAISFFIRKDWHFKVDKFIDLENFVPNNEFEDFAFFEKSHINYKEFIEQAIRGTKEFLLNESPHSSPGARRRVKIFGVLHYGIIIIGYALLARFLFNWICRI